MSETIVTQKRTLDLDVSTRTPTGNWGVQNVTTGAQNTHEDATLQKSVTQCVVSEVLGVTTTHAPQATTITITQSQTAPLTIATQCTNALHTTKILLKKGVHANIIEKITGENATHEVEITCEQDVIATYAAVQNTASYRAKKHTTLGKNAQFTWCDILEEHGASRIGTLLDGAHAQVTTCTLFIGEPGAALETYAGADHRVEHTTSHLFTRGILKSANAICEGELFINAAKSDAHQEAKCLVLDDVAIAKLSPRLFINNHDVTCSHATSSSRPDAHMLFYLQSKGLSKHDATTLIITAFLYELVEKLPASIQQHIGEIIREKIKILE